MPPLRGGGFHPGLRVDAEAVGNPVDVVEISDDLDGDGDLLLREAELAKSVEVTLPHVPRPDGQLGGEIAQGSILLNQGGGSVIVDQPVGDFGLIGLRTEVLGVG